MKRPEKTPAQTPAQRKAAQKARMESQGLVRFPVWIPDTPEAREAVKRLAESLCQTPTIHRAIS